MTLQCNEATDTKEHCSTDTLEFQWIGATVNVRPPVSNTPPTGQMDAEGVQSDRLEQMAAAQLLARQEGEQSEQGLITADGLRTILSDPSRIREAILLKEILDPPLALRN